MLIPITLKNVQNVIGEDFPQSRMIENKRKMIIFVGRFGFSYLLWILRAAY